MTPQDLADYLKVMKDSGVMSGQVQLGEGVAFAVQFEPPTPPAEKGHAAPGGWKEPTFTGPKDLDTSFLDDDK